MGMKSLKTKILNSKKYWGWASAAVALMLVFTIAPYAQNAFGELGGDPLQDEPVPVAVPVSEADIAERSETTNSEEEAVEDAVDATEQAAEDVAMTAMENEDEVVISPQEEPTIVTFDSNGEATIPAGKTGTAEGGVLTLPNDKNSYTLWVNGTFEGQIKVPAGKTLNLKGTGTINGKGQGSVIIVEGDGAKLVLNQDQDGEASGTGLTIIGGSGSPYSDNDGKIFGGKSKNVGGGILVKRVYADDEAELEIYNGTIGQADVKYDSGDTNYAQAGGGIFIDRNCKFKMHNGVITGNTAKTHEGGGIFMAGGQDRVNSDLYTYREDGTKTAEIIKGIISKNTKLNQEDWGGGGIFIERWGYLKVANIAVTGNHATGLGGGISGCPHASMGIGAITSGAAIYGNTATKYADPLNPKPLFPTDKLGLYDMGKTNKSGDIIAYKFDASEFTAAKAQDFYCTKASVVYGTNSEWIGRLAYYTTDELNGEYGRNVEIKQGDEFAVQGASLGLTAKPINPINPKNAAVQVIGNTSATHGGGIGCNGTLELGTLDYESKVSGSWTVEFKKELLKLDGSKSPLNADDNTTFTFEMYEPGNNGGIPADDATPIATATTDSSGKVTFNMHAENEGKFTYYVKEVIPSGNSTNKFIEYDTQWRKIDGRIFKQESELTDFPSHISSTLYYVNKEDITYSILDANGNLAAPGADEKTGSTFVNKVKPVQEKRDVTNGWSLTFDKSFASVGGANLFEASDADLNSYDVSTKFQFGLYVPNPDQEGLFNDDGTLNEDALKVDGEIDSSKLTQIAQASNATSGDNAGKVTFNFVDMNGEADDPLDDRIDAKAYRAANSEGTDATQQTYTFFVRELLPADGQQNDRIDYDTAWHKVTVTVKTTVEVSIDDMTSLTPTEWTTYTSSVADSDIAYFKAEKNEQNNTLQFVSTDGNKFTNTYRPEGDFSLNVNKEFYGDTEAAEGRFTFHMVSIDSADFDWTKNIYRIPDSSADAVLLTANNGEFIDNTATVAFDKVAFEEPGDYWFLIYEDDAANTATDTCRYVIKVAVSEADSGLVLSSEVTDVYYAEGVETNYFRQEFIRLNKLWSKPSADASDAQATPMPTLEFSNFSNSVQTFSLFGFAVNSATDEPIDQQCFVDPKIIKNLSGRSLVEGEFNFKLIDLTIPGSDEEPDWSQTEGPTISETSNDTYGMVDFDKANNVSGDLENPSCLAYTMPGWYYYRVVEANEKIDPTVDYSDQIITFTTHIVQDEETGQLTCAEMYYGHVEGKVNVKYDESVDDPNWHPDMYNFTKNMSLQVRKTSALDRDKGLEGATYGLYFVNNGAQADFLLGESTSDADGWITFEDLSLTTGKLYYFKEVAAPAGHTVSEFRSAYFYLVEDDSSPNGYSLEYSDIKIDPGEKATEAELAAASEAPIMSIASDEVAISAQSDNAVDDIMRFVFARDGGVYDEATNVEFTKLDTRTHEWVEGANLSIIEKSTGKVVNNWVSGKSAQKLQGVLNVNTVYILRENSAPEGYAKAEDVEFQIGEYGAVEILKGASNGNAEIQDSTIALYDTMLDGENLITEYREVPEDDVTIDEGGILPKLGDFMKVAWPVLVAISIILLLVIVSRRRKEGQEQ